MLFLELQLHFIFLKNILNIFLYFQLYIQLEIFMFVVFDDLNPSYWIICMKISIFALST